MKHNAATEMLELMMEKGKMAQATKRQPIILLDLWCASSICLSATVPFTCLVILYFMFCSGVFLNKKFPLNPIDFNLGTNTGLVFNKRAVLQWSTVHPANSLSPRNKSTSTKPIRVRITLDKNKKQIKINHPKQLYLRCVWKGINVAMRAVFGSTRVQWDNKNTGDKETTTLERLENGGRWAELRH